MTFTFKALAAAAVSLAVAAPAFAGQVAAGPGITLTEAAQAKFNRDTGRDNQQFSPVPGESSPAAVAQLAAVAGIEPGEAQAMSLNAIFVAKINREVGRDQQQLPKSTSVIMSSRSPSAANAQLIAAAGLTPAEAAGMTLTEIAAAKFNRETGRDNRQGY